MKGFFAIVGSSALYGVVAIAGSSGADSHSAPLLSAADDSAGAAVKIRDERLSVRFREAPLNSVLRELGRATQATFEVHGSMPPTVTEAFEAVPLEKGLRRLFRQADVSLLYAGSAVEPGASRRLVRVWIFATSAGTSAGRDAAPPAPHASTTRLERTLAAGADGGLEASIRSARSPDDFKGRSQPVDALADSGETGARDTLLVAMRDPEPDVRERAIDALGDFRDEAAIGLLSRALTQDEDEDVRESAADALGKIASSQSVDALKISLEDESPDVRESAVDALGRIGGPEVIQALHGALSDEDEDVRDVAAESLRKLAGSGPGEPSSGTAP